MINNLLGILGGMGVQATSRFCQMVTDMQSVTVEQEYIEMLVYNKTSTPNRTAFILGESKDSPLPSLLQAARALEAAGANCIAMPCVTAHYFYKELAAALSIPLLNILEETAAFAAEQGYGKVGLLATTGTVQGGFFQKAFARVGVDVILPNAMQQNALMKIIYDLKPGGELLTNALDELAASLRDKDAEVVVLGCTELSLLPTGHGYIDAMQVLAKAAVAKCQL